MTEVGEIFSSAVAHKEPDEHCPFCPPEKPQKFKTYPGEENNSKVLSAIMQSPASLTQKQPDARPKDGNPYELQNDEKSKLNYPHYANETYGEYSFEAHHAISGKQALKGHPIERWIWAAKGKIEADTGYSVNNSDNGTWQPSVPEKFKDGSWGSLSFEQKQAVANRVMNHGFGQFHKGPHNIQDPEDPEGEFHPSYDEELKRLLKNLNKLIKDWAKACYFCKSKSSGKLQPNWKVNQMLDRLSQAIIQDLKADRCEWYYFLSKLALEYHNPVCSHKHAKD